MCHMVEFSVMIASWTKAATNPASNTACAWVNSVGATGVGFFCYWCGYGLLVWGLLVIGGGLFLTSAVGLGHCPTPGAVLQHPSVRHHGAGRLRG